MQKTTLKALAALASPLLVVIDASAASQALAKQEARFAMLDSAVSSECLARAAATKLLYRKCRKDREALEYELASLILPRSFSSDNDVELLDHWIDELDVFETRVSDFCRSLVLGDASDSPLAHAGIELASTAWDESSTFDTKSSFSSAMYSRLTDFRDAVKSLDVQVQAAAGARDSLGSLSAPDSAATALERARNLLLDATAETGTSRLTAAAEKTHELLNEVEDALLECTRFLEDDRGLIYILEEARARCPVSVENIDEMLMEWSTLARKHGVSPFVLPSCHKALKSERDDNVEARVLLPKAVAAEEEALSQFQEACSTLSQERQAVASHLAQLVTDRLPSLGMSDTFFGVDLNAGVRECTDASAYSAASVFGVDSVDFLLLHSGKDTGDGSKRGGIVSEVASSGEKARILLAIECALPGSVGAACSTSGTDASLGIKSLWSGLPPIAVIYDEIDAHVGGRAAVALAHMLSDQSRSSQVVAITHSPSVAAVADMHVVIQKAAGNNAPPKGSVSINASVVDGPDRLKELARMASGDLAAEEAEVFADALIRDGMKRRNPADAVGAESSQSNNWFLDVD
jgi:DNA repair ATPase RecN